METTVNCPFCGSSHENPVYQYENTVVVTCEDCDEQFEVSGECEWRYRVEKR